MRGTLVAFIRASRFYRPAAGTVTYPKLIPILANEFTPPIASHPTATLSLQRTLSPPAPPCICYLLSAWLQVVEIGVSARRCLSSEEELFETALHHVNSYYEKPRGNGIHAANHCSQTWNIKNLACENIDSE